MKGWIRPRRYGDRNEATTVSEFMTVLRDRITGAKDALDAARDAGHDHEVNLHIARLRDLLDLARRHDVDTAGWVDAAALATQPYQD